MYTKHPTHPGGDEDGGEKEQGEHESHGEQAQPGDESDQAGIHKIFLILIKKVLEQRDQ